MRNFVGYVAAATAAASAIVIAAAPAARAQTLGVGDTAPALTVKEFVKGKPVHLQKGNLYVVEFWATWCGPCKVSIPHLTAMQKQYKNVTFVGVSVWDDQTKVKPFVTQMADKMDYCVAMDVVPPGAKSNDGVMAKSWMTAAGQNGIPTAFVVNKEGKIAWIGHPMAMEKPLAQIVAGKWDLTAASKSFKTEQVAALKMAAISAKISAAVKNNDYKAAVSIVDTAIADNPALESQFNSTKFALLRMGNDPGAAAYAEKLVATTIKNDTGSLNGLAWEVVDPKARMKPTPELIAVAVKAAERADLLTGGKDGAIADTLAAAYFASGDAKKALATEERAVKITKGAVDPDMTTRLEQYRKAAAGG